MFTSYALAAPTFFGSCARRKMPLLVFLSAQNSAWIWKSLYEFFVTSRLLLSFALSATIAPPSARQLASPRRLKFSSPFSPSMSVVQPIIPSIVVQPTASTAAAKTINRFMVGSLSWLCYSVLMLAALIIGHHFSISALWKA